MPGRVLLFDHVIPLFEINTAFSTWFPLPSHVAVAKASEGIEVIDIVSNTVMIGIAKSLELIFLFFMLLYTV